MDIATLVPVKSAAKPCPGRLREAPHELRQQENLTISITCTGPEKQNMKTLRPSRCQLRYRQQRRQSLMVDPNNPAPTVSITDDRRSLSNAMDIRFTCTDKIREPEKLAERGFDPRTFGL